MKWFITIWFILLFKGGCMGQIGDSVKNDSQSIFDLPDQKTMISLNINSPSFVRLLDGLQLNETFRIPENMPINAVERLNDSLKLNELGLKYPGKPYMILNTRRTPVTEYIYDETNISFLTYRGNLPIILNGQLIVPDKYSLLDKLDTNFIYKLEYWKRVPDKYREGFTMPWGAIAVFAKPAPE